MHDPISPPEELSKELGIERDEIVPYVLSRQSIPIYQGKIDKTLFQAHLEASGRKLRPR